ncbi:hypothetical protein CJU90_1016 [Yarrowia sp. C11]|nr:hypothetical protein CJU90_1016 [Yarrowia sp. C11]
MMSVLRSRKTVAQAWARQTLPSSLTNATWIDFTVGFSAFLVVAAYEYYRRSQPQTLVVEPQNPKPMVDMLWYSVAHIPSVCLREAFHDNSSNVIGMQQQINKCINEISSLASLTPVVAPSLVFPSLGHKATFIVLCALQLCLCLYTAFFLSKRRGTIKELYYDVKDVTESVEEAYYLINELNSSLAQNKSKSPTGISDTQKDQLIADVLSKMEDRFTHPIESIKTRLNTLENNVVSLQRATSNFNPRAPPYRGGSKAPRDPRSNENFRNVNGDFRTYDSRNDSRFTESNYSIDSRPWKPWNRTGGRSHVSSTPNSAPIEFYGEKRSFEKMEWADKHTVGSTHVIEPATDVIQSVARPISAVPVATTITGDAPANLQPASKLVVNCTPQQTKKIIIKAGDREYDLASAEGREQWSSVARRNISKAITYPDTKVSVVQVPASPPPHLAPLRTTTTRTHTIELSPLTSTYSSETDGTEVSRASKPEDKGGAKEERWASGLDNYIESVDSPKSPNASLSRGLQLKLEENVSKEKGSSGSIGDVTNGAASSDGEKKPYRRLFIPGRGWVSARRIAMEKAQEEQGGDTTLECERQELSASPPDADADAQPTAGENTVVAA